MVRSYQSGHCLEYPSHLFEYSLANPRMQAHHSPFLMGQRASFMPDSFGDTYLPNIMEKCRQPYHMLFFL